MNETRVTCAVWQYTKVDERQTAVAYLVNLVNFALQLLDFLVICNSNITIIIPLHKILLVLLSSRIVAKR